jgi:hypothetical protein
MVTPLTPKPTRKAEALARAPSTIASRREEDVALKEVAMLPRYRCASCILETKTTDGSTPSKAPVPRTNPTLDTQGRQMTQGFTHRCVYRPYSLVPDLKFPEIVSPLPSLGGLIG